MLIRFHAQIRPKIRQTIHSIRVVHDRASLTSSIGNEPLRLVNHVARSSAGNSDHGRRSNALPAIEQFAEEARFPFGGMYG
jgi:hypothetical protein